jgi:hypothetical protein
MFPGTLDLMACNLLIYDFPYVQTRNPRLQIGITEKGKTRPKKDCRREETAMAIRNRRRRRVSRNGESKNKTRKHRSGEGFKHREKTEGGKGREGRLTNRRIERWSRHRSL